MPPLPENPIEVIRERVTPEEPPREAANGPVSGILVPVLPSEPEPLVLYTRRAEHLSAHPGEISFPGGQREPGDDGPRATALRETGEEVGLGRDGIDLVGHFTDFRTHHGILISGYVGLVDPEAVLSAPTTPAEVAERLLVPLEALWRGKGRPPAEIGETVTLDGAPLGTVYPVEAYEARELPEEVRGGGRLHYWHLAPDTTIWGITGELTARFLRTALGWEPPRGPERVQGLDEVEP